MQWACAARVANRWRASYGAALLGVAAAGCSHGGSSNADGGRDARASAAMLADAGDGGLDAGDGGDAAPSDDTNLPAATSDELTARAKHLLEAVAHDNADLGVDMIFPRAAYAAVRDTADPGKSWDVRVVNAFRRSVHNLHRRSKGIEHAQFVSFELGHAVMQITPKKHEWKRPLWHVSRSKLTYTVDGRTQRIEIGEMTSWRGSWYVTKLR